MDPVFTIETIICITTFIVCFFHKDFNIMGFQDLDYILTYLFQLFTKDNKNPTCDINT